MAVRTIRAEGTLPPVGMERTSPVFVPSLSWTRSMWVKYPEAIGDPGSRYYTSFYSRASGTAWYVGSYAYISAVSDPVPNTFVQDLEVWDGSSFAFVQAAISPGVWTYITVRYTAGSTTLDLLINGVVRATLGASLALLSGALSDDWIGYDDPTATNSEGFSFWCEQWWQTALTTPQIAAQMASSWPLVTADLISFSQFWYPTQLNDLSGNGYTWAQNSASTNYETATGPLAKAPTKACVLPVVSRTGTGVQTVTGVQDADGNDFIGRLAFIISTGVALDTLGYQSGFNTGYVWEHGADDGVFGDASAIGDIERFTAKIASTGDSRRYSLLDYQPDIFFGGNFQGYAYISEFRQGELDITFDLNTRGGWGFMIVVLGGDDLIWDYSANILSGTYPTSGPPQGMLSFSAAYEMSSIFAATTAVGGGQSSWGWDTREGARAFVGFSVISQGWNARGLLSDRAWTTLGNGVVSGAPIVSAWGDASYTISSGYSTGVTRVAFSNCAVGATVVQLRTSPGNQTIELGIIPRWVKISTAGAVPNGTVDNTQAQLCVGWTNGVGQACAWAGETSPGFPGFPTKGARFLASDALIKISAAGAQAGATTYQVKASLVSINPTAGTITINVEETDGTPYELAIFALGDELADAPPQVVYGTTAPSWTLNRFDQKIRVEGLNGDPPARIPGRPIDWEPDGKRWKLERFDVRTRNEETA